MEHIFRQNVLFWLDAHGYGFKWPLKDEVRFIAEKFKHAYILIDDFKVPGLGCFGFDEYGTDALAMMYGYVNNQIEAKGADWGFIIFVVDSSNDADGSFNDGYSAWASADPGVQFHTTINEWHTCPENGSINASNPCSEYMFLDDTACNLASLNLVKFYNETKQKFNIKRLLR